MASASERMTMNDKARKLADVRREIDDIDTQLHDLIMRRAKIVEEVRQLKHNDKVKIRPAREAEIAYRLCARHRGNFPKRELMRMWREMIVATLRFEGPFSVAVKHDEAQPGLWDLARDQYGSFTPMQRHPTSRGVVDAVRRQDATVGILPWPAGDDADPWWRYMLGESADTPKVIARLPFVPGSNALGGEPDAVVISPVPQEKTGRDRSFIAVETEEELGSRTIERALNEAGVSAISQQVWHDPGRPAAWTYLVEVFGFVDPAGRQYPRFLDAIGKRGRRIVHLGGYGLPLTAADLADVLEDAATDDGGDTPGEEAAS